CVGRIEERVGNVPRIDEPGSEARAVVGTFTERVRGPASYPNDDLQWELQVVSYVSHGITGFKKAGALHGDQRVCSSQHQTGCQSDRFTLPSHPDWRQPRIQ